MRFSTVAVVSAAGVLSKEEYKAEKAKLDTETRRKCRLFWAPVCVGFGMICFFAGGWLL